MMQALYKHAKSFASNDDGRPVYQGIYFDGTSAVVTNSHVLLVIKDCPMPQRLLHYKTGRRIEGKFPDYHRAIPAIYSAELMIDKSGMANLLEWQKAIKVALQVAKLAADHYCIIGLKWDGEKLELGVDNQNEQGMRLSCDLPIAETDQSLCEPIATTINAQYLSSALAFFKDSEPTWLKIKFQAPADVGGVVVLESDQALIVISSIRTNREMGCGKRPLQKSYTL